MLQEAGFDWLGHTILIAFHTVCVCYGGCAHTTSSAVNTPWWPKSWSNHGLTNRTDCAGPVLPHYVVNILLFMFIICIYIDDALLGENLDSFNCTWCSQGLFVCYELGVLKICNYMHTLIIDSITNNVDEIRLTALRLDFVQPARTVQGVVAHAQRIDARSVRTLEHGGRATRCWQTCNTEMTMMSSISISTSSNNNDIIDKDQQQ